MKEFLKTFLICLACNSFAYFLAAIVLWYITNA